MGTLENLRFSKAALKYLEYGTVENKDRKEGAYKVKKNM